MTSPTSTRNRAGGWGSGNPPGLHPFAVGPWRAPSVNTNTFARESHIDILASKLGRDPLEFRLSHLSDPRMRRVLLAASEQFGWKSAPVPSGRGVGLACAIYLGHLCRHCRRGRGIQEHRERGSEAGRLCPGSGRHWAWVTLWQPDYSAWRINSLSLIPSAAAIQWLAFIFLGK